MAAPRLVMVSAGFEHGGNVLHRHLDGHPDAFVYPFESQLGTRNFSDFLASIERVQYRYPEFSDGLSALEIYESIIDEEMKTLLRKRSGSKFSRVDLDLEEHDRIQRFAEILGSGPYRRSQIIMAFFQSTQEAWKNLHNYGEPARVYIGYSPAIGLDADRMLKDFPDIRIIHVIRNPFSAYRDTKRRPFPQDLRRYAITWNLYHSTVAFYAALYPENVRIVRFEDLVKDKETFMVALAEFMDVEYSASMLYPSWNGVPLDGDIAPWGTVLRATEEYNRSIIDDLSADEIKSISLATRAVCAHIGYDDVSYVRCHF